MDVVGEDSPKGSASRSNLQSDSITIDPSHELYLYPSDNPSNALVSNLLDGQNYGHWRKTVEIALIPKNKIGFVRGTCKKPDHDSPLANQWERCDKMVIFFYHELSNQKHFRQCVVFKLI